MKKFVQVVVVVVLLLPVIPISRSVAFTAPIAPIGVIISELSSGDTKSASNEFVELYNDSMQLVDLSGLKLDYKSANGETWYVKATIPAGTNLASHRYLIIKSYDGGDVTMQSGLAQSAGNIRLLDPAGGVIDQLAWGQADSALGSPAPVAKLDQTVARRLGSDGSYQNSLDNSVDFAIGLPTPGVDNIISVDSDGGTNQSSDIPPINFSRDITVTELLPDPVKPQTDSQDEFIELYNDGDNDQILGGYSLVDASGHTYKLDGQMIRAHDYLVLYSAQAKISLNNDGDTITLLAPNGEELITTPDYGKSKSGKSWGVTPDGWAWTMNPTPGAVNAAQLSDDDASAASANKKSSTKSTSAKAKTASAKSSKVAKKAGAKSGASDANMTDEDNNGSSSNWSWLLILLGIATIGYGIYEYRPEITGFIQKLRAKFGVGKKTRPKT